MSIVIDVDSHYEPLFPDPRDHPLSALGIDVPSVEEIVVESLAGDLWAATSADLRTELEPQIPALRHLRGIDTETEVKMMATTERHAACDDADARVAWMDSVGIDFALVNPGGVYSGAVALTRRFFPERSTFQAAVQICNDVLADWTAGHTHRLGPVALIDATDIEWSVRELERMRALGSRAAHVRAEPFGGRSPAHPDHDRLWECMASLGMVAVLHIGSTPARFDDGWADAGWLAPGGGGIGGYLRLANGSRLESAHRLISALVFGGVFERIPNLTLVLSELWASWVPWTLSRLDQLGDGNGALGPWGQSLSPGELMRRNVKVTPLPGLGDDGMHVLADIPEVLVFSSDFPHAEGNPDPIGIYGDVLASQPEPLRSAFLGDTMAEVFARTGDPIA